jgi:MinD-like ATPase involved in chromosome partitioning or flagellar assembly
MTGQIDALRRFLGRNAAARPRRAVVVVGSGKGGSGASTVAALLALVSAAEGLRVLLVDAVPDFGALHLLLGAEPGPGLGALRGGDLEPEDLLVPVADGLSLVTCASADEPGAAPGDVERRALLRRIAGLYDAFELVVVDGGSRRDAVLAACDAGAARLALVCGTDRIALAATHAIVKVAAAAAQAIPVSILFNRAGDAEAEAAFDVLRDGVGRFLGRTVGLAGSVPDDPGFRHAIETGLTIQAAAARSAIAGAVRDLAERIAPIGSHAERAAPALVTTHGWA